MIEAFLSSVIKTGRLTVKLGENRVFEVGSGCGEVSLQIALRNPLTAFRIMLLPDLALGEAYMDGDLTVLNGDIWDLLRLVGDNLDNLAQTRSALLFRGSLGLLSAMQNQRPAGARRNVAHHYDLSNTLYRQFLDADLHYSCAYFDPPTASLEEAQQAKVARLLRKLDLRPGQTVLDIGCGWGSLALAIAREADVTVHGVTLSQSQLEIARQRAKQEGLSHRVDFRLLDYRHVTGQYDRIISVGMFEHVGAAHHRTFFRVVNDRLAEDGVAVVHTIGARARGAGQNPWINKYIFPGGYIPTLSEASDSLERAGLWVSDVEALRLHYAATLREWRARFAAARSLISELYDERFVRMWDFYLASCEMGFRYGGLMVLQLQMTKRVDTLPITRDYMMTAASGDLHAGAPLNLERRRSWLHPSEGRHAGAGRNAGRT